MFQGFNNSLAQYIFCSPGSSPSTLPPLGGSLSQHERLLSLVPSFPSSTKSMRRVRRVATAQRWVLKLFRLEKAFPNGLNKKHLYKNTPVSNHWFRWTEPNKDQWWALELRPELRSCAGLNSGGDCTRSVEHLLLCFVFVDLAIWLGGNDGKGIGGYKNPIGVWFFCPRKATQEKGNQCLLSLQKPYVFLSKNNTISTSICFLFSRKKWSEKKSANSGDETVEKLIILDFPAFFAIFFKGIGSFYLSRDIFPFQTNNL